MSIRTSDLYGLFIFLVLLTEFFYINIGGGVARASQFLAPVVVLLSISAWHLLFGSRTFLALLVFVAINIAAASFSDSPSAAFASLSSFLANVTTSMAVALFMVRSKLSLKSMVNIILVAAVISVLWGLIQIIAFRAGIMLALSEQQEAQIANGFGPGFKTEANTFGKFLLMPFLLMLPFYLRTPNSKKLKYSYLLLIVGMLMNFTRTAMFGLLAAMAFAVFWYSATGNISLVANRALKMVAIFAIGIAAIVAGAVQVSDYAKYKIESLFEASTLADDGSSAYRTESMAVVVEFALSSDRRMAIGNGWGQTYGVVQGQDVQAGGGDLINILGYSGLLGVAAYLFYSLMAFLSFKHAASRDTNSTRALYAEGLMFAMVGIFVTSQMSGFLIAPEYWLLLGVAIYIGLDRDADRCVYPR